MKSRQQSPKNTNVSLNRKYKVRDSRISRHRISRISQTQFNSICDSKSLKKAENNSKEKTNKKGQVRPTYKFKNSTTVQFCESFDC